MTITKREAFMSNEERLAILETTSAHILDTLARIDNRFIALDQKIDSKFDTLDKKIDSKFDTLDRKIDSNFKWLLTIMIGGFVGTWGVLSHVLHWV